jgi:hypothetical protein
MRKGHSSTALKTRYLIRYHTFHFDVDPDPDPACHFDADPDKDPTFQFDVDPDPSFQIKA